PWPSLNTPSGAAAAEAASTSEASEPAAEAPPAPSTSPAAAPSPTHPQPPPAFPALPRARRPGRDDHEHDGQNEHPLRQLARVEPRPLGRGRRVLAHQRDAELVGEGLREERDALLEAAGIGPPREVRIHRVADPADPGVGEEPLGPAARRDEDLARAGPM